MSRSWARDRPPHYADRLRSKDLVRACLDSLDNLDSLDGSLDSLAALSLRVKDRFPLLLSLPAEVSKARQDGREEKKSQRIEQHC